MLKQVKRQGEIWGWGEGEGIPVLGHGKGVGGVRIVM